MQSTHLLCPNCEKNHFMLKKLRLIPMIVSAVTAIIAVLPRKALTQPELTTLMLR